MARRKPIPKKTDEVYLSNSITVANYRALEAQQDREGIANFVYERFVERYIEPLDRTPYQHRSGFTSMAVCCLMIEALESFRQGWGNSERQSKAAFCFFFDRNDRFRELRGHAQDFYKHVRCGILHQAETTGGWLVRRDQSVLFDPTTRVVDASIFLQALHSSLKDYCVDLRGSDWESEIWINFRKKMAAIIKNCQR